MPTIDQLKEQETPPTPLFLFDCVLKSGATERWGTHAVNFGGNSYDARLLRHNLFELRASSEDGLDGSAKISVTLANGILASPKSSARRGSRAGRADHGIDVPTDIQQSAESATDRAARGADRTAVPLDLSIERVAAGGSARR